jgi:nifR3 family TIM-barrel protein
MILKGFSAGRLLLAPMSKVTTLPFRLLCKKYGASVVYSEMINADALVMQSEKTLKRTFFLDEERPIGIQLSGSDIDVLTKAVKMVETYMKPDLIDVNLGCPDYSVMRSGCGASWLKDPEKIGYLVKQLSGATHLPLTCKIRVVKDEETTIRIAKIIERNGSSAIAVHGRTAEQRYTGKADWGIVAKVKENLRIPVILNGDVVDEESASQAFSLGVDALMIGRAAIGNPYIFRRILHYLDTAKRLPAQDLNDKISDFSQFIHLALKYGYTDTTNLKMQAQYFTKNHPGSGKVRLELTTAKDINEIVSIISNFLTGKKE